MFSSLIEHSLDFERPRVARFGQVPNLRLPSLQLFEFEEVEIATGLGAKIGHPEEVMHTAYAGSGLMVIKMFTELSRLIYIWRRNHLVAISSM